MPVGALCGLAIGVLLVVAVGLLWALLLTRAALVQARLEHEQNDHDWRAAVQQLQRRRSMKD